MSDSADAAALRSGGTRVAGARVVLWYPTDSLAPSHARALADSLDRGVAAMEALVGAPYPWQELAGRPVVYWLVPRRFVSHAADGSDGPGVYIPLRRAQGGAAPYLHEAAHLLLWPAGGFGDVRGPADTAGMLRRFASMPPWLLEGLAQAVSHDARVAGAPGVVREFDVFDTGTPATNDSVCAALARGPRGAEALAAVGPADRAARLEPLYTVEGRTTLAPTFYTCARSFTRFLFARAGGPPAFVARLPELREKGLDATVRAVAGQPLAAVRQAWLRRLALAP